LVQNNFSDLTAANLLEYKRQWARLLKRTPRNSEILEAYKSLSKTRGKGLNQEILTSLTTRKVRSLSGVTPFAVMTKPFTCPGLCTFCPLELNMPKSYLSDEPAGQRAQAVDFDPYLQVKSRLDQLEATGHHTQKIELIVIGGTFSAYPESYKKEFFLGMLNAINDKKFKDLVEAQVYNETAERRIVGISIETRPDWVDEKEIILLRFLGVTKLQVGVQALDGKILKRVKRGHSIRPIARATTMLRNAGFKICYHYMPNLPGSNPKKDVEMARMMYQDKRFKPDFVKIYPTQVIPGTALHREWERGEFETYDDEAMIKVLKKIKLLTPKYCRIDRLVRDISKKWVAGGTIKTNMRQIIGEELKAEGKECKCIRCREVKQLEYGVKPDYKEHSYETVGGVEKLLTFERDNKLYSLLRLRLPNSRQKMVFDELKGAAIIREIHTFGVAKKIKNKKLKIKNDKTTQHRGLGKQLLLKAEGIAQRSKYKKIAVISAIGTKNYYRKLGFDLDGLYMTKYI